MADAGGSVPLAEAVCMAMIRVLGNRNPFYLDVASCCSAKVSLSGVS